RIPSGAGHDAAVFAAAGIPAAMLFVRNANGSHNPHEAMDIDDFLQGTRWLAEGLLAD
ncbi:MAG: M20/M25/M40 family metallo-hydrolase, partial [Comamonadaceae bacterium]